jgi:translation initiation factor 2 alpha subunit (eIF-2alpha)
MSTTSTDKQQAIELMEKAVEAIGEKIVEERGDMVVKMKVSGRRTSHRFYHHPLLLLVSLNRN